ncbi:TenA family protein [Bifidobacterium aquikefiri]|uniref:TenA family protein n=1 Tax=Bifidobacterium aquikefiri TaxID=1653207 RepID=UPI0039E7C0F7
MNDVYTACKEHCRDEWEAAVNHRFNRELVSDTLHDEVLRDYLIQDWQYTSGFYSLLGQAVASADLLSSKIRLSQQLGFISNDEDTYFRDRFEQFNVSQNEIDHPILTPSSAGITELYTKTVETRFYADAIAVLCVAESLYLEWTQRLTDFGKKLPQKEQNLGWVRLHLEDGFIEWVDFLIQELNRVGHAHDKKLLARFAQAVHWELEFFNDAYRDERS